MAPVLRAVGFSGRQPEGSTRTADYRWGSSLPRRPDITSTLSYRVLLLSNTLARWAAREYPRRFGVSLPEWRVLSIVAARSPVAVNAIADAVSVDKAWVSRTLRRLARGGYIRPRQDPRDERRVLIEITLKGRAKAEEMLRASQNRQRRLVAGLRSADLGRFLKMLASLQARAEAMLVADLPAPRSLGVRRSTSVPSRAPHRRKNKITKGATA